MAAEGRARSCSFPAAAAGAAPCSEQASRGSAEQARMDFCSRARPNLLLAGGTGLPRRGTAAGIFCRGSPQQTGSWASTEFCLQIRLSGPGRAPVGFPFPLWYLQAVSGRAEGGSLGFPVPSHHRALLQGCSAPSGPSLARAERVRAPSPSLRGCPRRALRLLGSFLGEPRCLVWPRHVCQLSPEGTG